MSTNSSFRYERVKQSVRASSWRQALEVVYWPDLNPAVSRPEPMENSGLPQAY